MDNRPYLDKPLRFDSPVTAPPLSRYGITKLRAEEFLKSEAKRQGFRLSIVRCCTVYGPNPRPNSLFDVLSREVKKRSLVSRLNWPGLTSFIHVDDLVACLLRIANDPPEPGHTRSYLLAAESHALQQVACLLYRTAGLPYRLVSLPTPVWNRLRNVHLLCRYARHFLPTRLYNHLWRFNLLVNPVFHCDTRQMTDWFPDLNPRRMADCIGEICGDWSSLLGANANRACAAVGATAPTSWRTPKADARQKGSFSAS